MSPSPPKPGPCLCDRIATAHDVRKVAVCDLSTVDMLALFRRDLERARMAAGPDQVSRPRLLLEDEWMREGIEP